MWESFVDFDIRHRMLSAKIVLYDLDLRFEGKNLNFLYISLKW